MSVHPRVFTATRNRWIVQAGAFAAALIIGQRAPAAQEIWQSSQSAAWSNPIAWLDGTPPVAGGNIDLELVFNNRSFSAAITSTNDLPGIFTLNRITLDSESNALLTIAGNSGTSLRFVGVDPAIEINGTGNVTINSAIDIVLPSTAVTIRGGGLGTLTLKGPITGTQPLVIQSASGSRSPFVTLEGSNTFSGGITLKSGKLSVASDAAFGSGSLRVEGGTLRVPASFGRAIQLQGDLTFDSAVGVTGTVSSVISELNSGRGITVRNGLTLTGVSTYSGTTNLAPGLLAENANTGAALTLSSSGSLLNSSAVNIGAGSTLRIDALSTGATNRLADTTPVNLRGGTLFFAGVSGSTAQTETVGTVSAAGYSTISVLGSGTPGSRLTGSSLVRVERGTLLLRGSQLGGIPASGIANILFSTAPTGLIGGNGPGANTSILPWAIGDSSSQGTGTSLVTYSPTSGIRPLNLSTEFNNSLSTAASTNNVFVGTAQTLSGSRTINSLVLNTGNITGSGTLTITSGMILQRAGAGIHVPLDFGAVEANVFTVGDLLINGSISGSGGLTKSSAGILNLSGANTFTGTLTINAGVVAFSSLQNLGADTSAIVLAGQGAGLSYEGAGNLTLSRPVETRIGLGRLEVTGTGNLTLSAPISGSGGLQLSAAAGSSITLPAGSAYTGPTQILGGGIIISDDSALGSGGDLHISAATLSLAGNWVSSRAVNAANGIVDTAGFNATWSGVTTGSILRKSGEGTLQLNAPSLVDSVDVRKGVLELAGDAKLRSSQVITQKGGEIRLDNSGTNVDGRISDTATVTLRDGALTLVGNSSAPLVEAVGALSLAKYGNNRITLGVPGNQSVSLHLNRGIFYGDADTGLVISASDLGGSSSGVFQRLVTNEPSPLTGFISRIYAATDGTGIANSFVAYDSASDAAGTIGFRPLKSAEYSTGGTISNPANGGTTAVDAHFLAAGAVGTNGPANTIKSITLNAGSTLTIGNNRNLDISSGQMLVRSGAGKVVVEQGSLSFGPGRAEIYAGGDIEIASSVRGNAGLWKTGPGTLTLQPGSIGYSGQTKVLAGALRSGSPLLLAGNEVVLRGTGSYALDAGAATVGGISGDGKISIGGGTLTLGTLPSDFIFEGELNGSGQVVIVDGGTPAALRQLNGMSSFTGEIKLQSGRLSLGSNTALGPATLVVAGGSLRAGAALRIAPAIQLQTDLSLRGNPTITLLPGTAITGAHDVRIEGSEKLEIETALNLGGDLITRPNVTDEYVFTAGDITVQGATGSIASANAVRIEGGANLTLSYANGYQGPANVRVNDAIPIHFRAGNLELIAGPTANAAETIGALRISGSSHLVVTPTTTSNAALTIASIERADRAGVQFKNSIGQLDGVSGQILIGTAPDLVGGNGTGAAKSIIPWASSTSGLVTYEAGGIRRLIPGEYVALAAADPTLNVSIDAIITNNSTVAMNALRVAVGTLNGSGTLQVLSGAVVLNIGTATISNNFDFGSAEGHFHFPSSGTLTLPGVISGTNGLTKTGGTLVLSGNNTFSGPITINSGTIEFGSAANLGANSGIISLNGSSVTSGTSSILSYTQSGSVTVARDIHVGPGTSNIRVEKFGGFLDLTGRISGEGALNLNSSVRIADASGLAGVIQTSGSLRLAPNAQLGAAGLELTAGSVITLDGPFSTDKKVKFNYLGGFPSTVELDTNGFDAVLNGELTGGGTDLVLLKDGAGTLSLLNRTGFSGIMNVNKGELRLAESGSIGSLSLSATGAQISLDNGGSALPDRVGNTATVLLSHGEFRLMGNPITLVTETIGKVETAAGANAVTLHSPGTNPVALTIGELSLGGNQVLFRGDNLGGDSGGYSRIVFQAVPQLSNGLIPGAFAGATANGQADSFAVYDQGTDGNGTIGVRLLNPSEITVGSEIRNPANGGTVPVSANFRSSTAITAVGAVNQINSLQLGGLATMNLGPSQIILIGAPGILIETGANALISGGTLTVEGTEAPLFVGGQLTLSSRVTNASISKLGTGTLEVLSPARIDGDLKLAAGTLRFSGNAFRGSGIDSQTGTQIDVLSDAIVNKLEGAPAVNIAAGILRIDREISSDVSSITGAGGLSLGGTGGSSTKAWNYSGPTIIRDGATLTLSGEGVIPSTSSLSVSGGYLTLFNSEIARSRLGQVPLELNGGQFSIYDSATAQVSETLGILTVRGGATVANMVTVGGSAPLLTFGGLNRLDRASVNFSGVQLPGQAAVFFPPSLANDQIGGGEPTSTPILPYAFKYTNSSLSTVGFVTVIPGGGVRVLNSSEYASGLASSQNSIVSTSTVVDSVVKLNSLFITQGIQGTGTIQIASGAIFFRSSPYINCNLDFGSREAHFSSAEGSLSLGGTLLGSNGLTMAGPGILVLSNDNRITGPITINGGTLRLLTAGSLGLDTSEIVINEGTLDYNGIGELVASRPLRFNGTFPKIKVGFNDTLRLTQPVVGSSEINLTKSGEGRLIIEKGSEFLGTATIAEGSLEIHSGASGTIVANRGTLFFGDGLAQLKGGSTLPLKIETGVQLPLITASSGITLGDNISLDLQLQFYNPVDGVDFYYLVRNDSNLPVEKLSPSPFRFSGNPLSEGEVFLASGQYWRFSYAGGDGNDVVIAAVVPEPNAAALIALASSLAGWTRRARRFIIE